MSSSKTTSKTVASFKKEMNGTTKQQTYLTIYSKRNVLPFFTAAPRRQFILLKKKIHDFQAKEKRN
jgi:hypothetical protein